MSACLLDTDMLSEVLKRKNSTVVFRSAEYLQREGRFIISAISRYEVRRGLIARQAAAQLHRFEVFCDRSTVLSITDEVLDRAAHLWATARKLGRIPQDPDLIIAATALLADLVLVTGNTEHFAWIEGLNLANWRQQ